MSTLEHALSLAAQGFAVFPLKPGDNTPAHTGWQAEATSDAAAVRKLWGRRNYGVGIFTGPEDRPLLVVDIDNKDGRDGFASLMKLELNSQELPPTRAHATKSGGRHLIFSVPKPVKQGVDVLGPGLDVRSKGGFVVAPGTPGYSVTADQPIAEAPQWLVDACGLVDESPPQASTKLPGIDPERARRRSVEYLESLDTVSEGARNDAAFRAAAQIKDYGLDAPECEAVMLEHFKCSPMLDELPTTIASVYRNSKNPQGSAAPEAIFLPVQEPHEPKAPHYRLMSVGDLLSRPRPTWLVRGLLPRRGLGVIYGAPGSGKSFLALDVCAAIARGESWGGLRVKPGPVVYVGLEGELAPRVAAYLKHYELERADVPGLILIEREPLNFLHERNQHVRWLVEDLMASGPVSLVVVDTLNRAMPGGNENASEDMGRAIACASQISSELDCLCVLVHHSGKDASAGARGHSSLLGAADAELEVSRGQDGRTRYVRATKVKEGEDGARFSFHLESVDLGATIEHDPDADPLERDASCVVVGLQPAETNPGQKRRNWTPSRRNVFAALQSVLANTWADENTPATCSVDQWQATYYDTTPIPENLEAREHRTATESRRKEFTRAKDWLVAEGLAKPVKRKGSTVYELGANP